MRKQNQPIILACETTTPTLSLSLYKNGRVITTTKAKDFAQHSSLMIPMLDRLLRQTNTRLSDVTLFGVNIGPGSFTGIRIGLSFIKTLALELKRNIIITNSFFLMLQGLLQKIQKIDEGSHIILLVKSLKSEAYHSEYKYSHGILKQSGKESYDRYDHIKERLKKLQQKNIIIAGNDLEECNALTHDLKSFQYVKIDSRNIIDIYLSKNLKLVNKSKVFSRSNYKIISPKNLTPYYLRHTYY
ncbi:peptidase-like protein [sediment metagenome]|uniref:Peptidase-like protein n=1 Tax=sediment metagenome TaxID=749907 RepID=D9PN23_9ZZZZ